MLKNIDHFATFCLNNDLDGTLTQWERAGFIIREDRTRSGGRKNGFIQLTGGYIEVCSVENEDTFRQNSSELERQLRTNPSIHFVVFSNTEPKLTWEKLRIRFPDIQSDERSYHAETPSFSFCSFPLHATPGAYVSSIQYPTNKAVELLSKISIGPNSIFGITGFVMVSESPIEDAALWFDTLSPELSNAKMIKNSISNGFQSIDWISKAEFETAYEGWSGPSQEYNRIGVVKLGAENLQVAREYVEKAGFDVSSSSDRIIVKKDRNTGLCFLIEQASAQSYFSALKKLNV